MPAKARPKRRSTRPKTEKSQLGRHQARTSLANWFVADLGIVLMLTILVLPVPPAAAQTKELILGDGGLVEYDPQDSQTWSEAVAKSNAAQIQSALETKDGKAIVLAGGWYAVTDHDGDGVDVAIGNTEGLVFRGAGGLSTRRFPADVSGEYNPQGTILLHVNYDGDVTDDVVLEISNAQYASIGPITIVGARVNNSTAANNAFSSGNMVGTALRFRNANDTPDKGVDVWLATILCRTGIVNTSSGDDDAFNSIKIRDMQTKNIYRMFDSPGGVVSQALGTQIKNVWHSGSGIPAGWSYIRDAGGGDLSIDEAFVSPGIFVEFEPVSAGANLVIHNFRVDPNISQQQGQRLFASNKYTIGEMRVRISGNYRPDGGGNPARQQIRSRQFRTLSPVRTRAYDIQTDVKQFGTEGLAYPIRPHRSFELPIPPTNRMPLLTETKLWVAAEVEADIEDHHTIDADGDDLRTTQIDDRSSTGNHLTQASPGEAPFFRAGSNLNKRPSLCMGSGFSESVNQRWASNTSPVDLDDSVGDLTVMAVVLADQGFDGGAIIACEDGEDPMTGWAMGVNDEFQPYFRVGDGENTGLALLTDLDPRIDGDQLVRHSDDNSYRRYLFIGRREATGEVSITVDGVTATDDGPTGILPDSGSRLIVGGRWTGSQAEDRWEGWFGPIIVVADDLFSVGTSDTYNTLDGTTDGNRVRNYLRAGWGVW